MIEFVHSQGLNSYVYSSGVYMDDLNVRGPVPDRILEKIAGKVTKLIYNIEAAEEKNIRYNYGNAGMLQIFRGINPEVSSIGYCCGGAFCPK
ncbi:MAG: hypothetical protein ACLSE4_04200 [Clostridium sp.]